MASDQQVRPAFLYAFGAVLAAAVVVVGAIQVLGGEMGAPCADSYSCAGFLIGGAECVAVDDRAYCTRYCDTDADCPDGWRCESAHPTVLAVETSALDEVCMR